MRVLVQHPTIASMHNIALAFFYDSRVEGGFRGIVINRAGGIYRSPWGAGSGALAIYQHTLGNI